MAPGKLLTVPWFREVTFSVNFSSSNSAWTNCVGPDGVNAHVELVEVH